MENKDKFCPVCGTEGEFRKEIKTEKFRNENFENIIEFYYYCPKCKDDFLSAEMMDLNLVQIYNQYRERHDILFPEEIKKLRDDYELSTVKMSKLLGFGENVYRNYENGEVPSISNASILNLANDPFVFEKMVSGKMNSKADLLSKFEYETLFEKIKAKQEYIQKKKDLIGFISDNIGRPSIYNGYKMFDINKYAHSVIFFLENYGSSFKTYINKFLFYSDFLNYKITGFSITGTEYVALPKGPCPDRFDLFYEIMKEKEFVSIEETTTENGVFEKYENAVNYNEELFSITEKYSLFNTLVFFKSIVPIKNIVDISHSEKGWIENEASKSKIDYQKYAFEVRGV